RIVERDLGSPVGTARVCDRDKFQQITQFSPTPLQAQPHFSFRPAPVLRGAAQENMSRRDPLGFLLQRGIPGEKNYALCGIAESVKHGRFLCSHHWFETSTESPLVAST